MRKRKTTTREKYKERFDNYMKKINYVPQAHEKWVQLEEKDYYFYSNYGYMVSMHSNKGKVLKPFMTGKKELRQNSNYKIDNKNVKMQTLTDKYFVESFVHPDFFGEKREIHHITKYDKSKAPQKNNNEFNLQNLPAKVHKEVTHIQTKSYEDMQKNEKKASKEIKCANLNQVVVDLLSHSTGTALYMLLNTYNKDNMDKPIQSAAYTLTKETLIEKLKEAK